MLNAVGMDQTSYEDFVDATCKLLEQMAATLPNHDGAASLLADFNVENGPWAEITVHFRVSRFICFYCYYLLC